MDQSQARRAAAILNRRRGAHSGISTPIVAIGVGQGWAPRPQWTVAEFGASTSVEHWLTGPERRALLGT